MMLAHYMWALTQQNILLFDHSVQVGLIWTDRQTCDRAGPLLFQQSEEVWLTFFSLCNTSTSSSLLSKKFTHTQITKLICWLVGHNNRHNTVTHKPNALLFPLIQMWSVARHNCLPDLWPLGSECRMSEPRSFEGHIWPLVVYGCRTSWKVKSERAAKMKTL